MAILSLPTILSALARLFIMPSKLLTLSKTFSFLMSSGKESLHPSLRIPSALTRGAVGSPVGSVVGVTAAGSVVASVMIYLSVRQFIAYLELPD